jgi:hypothetical protein
MSSLSAAADLLPRERRRQKRIGHEDGGLAAYRPQFPQLLPQPTEACDHENFDNGKWHTHCGQRSVSGSLKKESASARIGQWAGAYREPLPDGLGVGPDRDGTFSCIASEGALTPGALLGSGNTTSRFDEHRAADIGAASSRLGIPRRHLEMKASA